MEPVDISSDNFFDCHALNTKILYPNQKMKKDKFDEIKNPVQDEEETIEMHWILKEIMNQSKEDKNRTKLIEQ